MSSASCRRIPVQTAAKPLVLRTLPSCPERPRHCRVSAGRGCGARRLACARGRRHCCGVAWASHGTRCCVTQSAGLGRLDAVDLEVRDQVAQLGGFGSECAGGSVRFLDHCGVLLGRLVHGVNGLVDFRKAGRLFLGRNRDGIHMRVHLADEAANGAQRSPVLRTRSTPPATSVEEFWMSALISFAAFAERWASSRTSWATTAKPLPASPARAASTPALRASSWSGRRFRQ